MSQVSKTLRPLVGMVVGIIVIYTIGCGKDQKSNELKTDPFTLAQSDLQALDSFDETGPRAYDESSNKRFIQIFGGYSGRNIRNFIDERIQHYVRETDIVSVSPGHPVHTGWSQMPSVPDVGVTGAYNLGTVYWLQGLLDSTPFTVTLANGKSITTSSSRIGIMVFGPGYSDQIDLGTDGLKIKMPVGVRQSMLVHEAVHSDCPGGISQADIYRARQAKSYAEFLGGLQARKCGHLHSLCRSGDFQGLPSCDSETWGSYGIQGIFLKAILRNFPEGTTEWQVLNAVTIDMMSRLEFSFSQMIHSQTDHPNLTSSGLR